MYLRPLTFVIGAGVSLVLLFVGKARFDGGHTWYRSYHLGNESTAQVVATSNTVKEVPDVVEYSVREHVTNSTLGVSKRTGDFLTSLPLTVASSLKRSSLLVFLSAPIVEIN